MEELEEIIEEIKKIEGKTVRSSLPHRRRRVFSFFDFRSSFSRFSDFIEASAQKKKERLERV